MAGWASGAFPTPMPRNTNMSAFLDFAVAFALKTGVSLPRDTKTSHFLDFASRQKAVRDAGDIVLFSGASASQAPVMGANKA